MWFLNTSSCKQYLILAYFMCKKIFKPFLDLANCYDNYIYNYIDIDQVPEFD